MPSELLRRAIYFLEAHGPASSSELAEHVFGGRAFAPLLCSLPAERLVHQGDVWRLREPEPSYVVLELLASGPNPGRHRLVEVAALSGSNRFQALIASGKPIPAVLRKLGLPEEPRECAPDAGWLTLAEASAALREFVGTATVVGFSYGPAFLEQLLGPAWPAVDLLRLVFALSGFRGRPDPPRLARHFGLTAPASRRPAGMLPFSAALLTRLRGNCSLERLRDIGRPQAPAPPNHPALPSGQAGVYVMSGHGDPLYVGKSIDVRRRVGSYLGTPIAESRGLYHLLDLTDRIDVIPVDSETEALLLEARLIEDLLPAFNVQRRVGPRACYLRLSVQDAFPRLTLATSPAADGATYFGPFRHASAASRLRALLASVLRLRACTRKLPSTRKPAPPCGRAASGACLAPCIPGPPPSPYAAEVELARQLLIASPEEFRRLLLRILRERPPNNALKLKRQLESLRAPSPPSAMPATDAGPWDEAGRMAL